MVVPVLEPGARLLGPVGSLQLPAVLGVVVEPLPVSLGLLPVLGALGTLGSWVAPEGRVASAPPELPGM